MQNLSSYILESGISDAERSYREFCGMCLAKGLNVEDITVQETPRHNWKVFNGDRKIFLVSKYILTKDIIEKYGIKVKE